MRPVDRFTPAEFRLAVLLFLLALVGTVVDGGETLSPEVAVWLESLDPGFPADTLEAGQLAVREAPRTTPSPGGIDPNTANADRLTDLPGIGPALASRVVAAREVGPFQVAEDLLRVRGIGPSTLARIRPHLVFGDTTEVGDSPQPADRPRQP